MWDAGKKAGYNGEDGIGGEWRRGGVGIGVRGEGRGRRSSCEGKDDTVVRKW